MSAVSCARRPPGCQQRQRHRATPRPFENMVMAVMAEQRWQSARGTRRAGGMLRGIFSPRPRAPRRPTVVCGTRKRKLKGERRDRGAQGAAMARRGCAEKEGSARSAYLMHGSSYSSLYGEETAIPSPRARRGRAVCIWPYGRGVAMPLSSAAGKGSRSRGGGGQPQPGGARNKPESKSHVFLHVCGYIKHRLLVRCIYFCAAQRPTDLLRPAVKPHSSSRLSPPSHDIHCIAAPHSHTHTALTTANIIRECPRRCASER